MSHLHLFSPPLRGKRKIQIKKIKKNKKGKKKKKQNEPKMSVMPINRIHEFIGPSLASANGHLPGSHPDSVGCSERRKIFVLLY